MHRRQIQMDMEKMHTTFLKLKNVYVILYENINIIIMRATDKIKQKHIIL